jgi:curved DNA-binding protein CbpA
VQHTFTISEYCEILGLPADASVEEIKKAYRKKARLYHPDINHARNAKDMFIRATEAYEFLLAYHEKIRHDEEEFLQAMEEWRLYRQKRSRDKARAYARTSYNSFRNSKFYRSTRILDGTSIVFSFTISILVLIYTVYGYIYRLRHPLPGLEKPSVFTFVMLLLLGLTFFTISFIYLKAYMENSNKKNRHH